MKQESSFGGVEGKSKGKGRGLLIAAGSLALLWVFAFLKGRAKSDLKT